jgi:site-specific recombinase XerD
MARYKSGADHTALLHGYILTMERKRFAPSTQQKERAKLRAFLNDHPGETWKHLTADQLETWLDQRRGYKRDDSGKPVHNGRNQPPTDGPGVTANTLAGWKYLLSKFYAWAVAEHYLRTNPAATLEPVKKTKSLPQPLNREDAATVLALADPDTPTGRTIALMLFAGLRCMECAGLRWRDVDRGARRIRIHGKGNVTRYVNIHDALAYYLAVRGEPDAPVIGVVWTPKHLSRKVKQAFTAVGLSDSHAHQLRHTMATEYYARTGDLLGLADLLGHQSVETTQMYAKVSDSTKAANIAKLDYGYLPWMAAAATVAPTVRHDQPRRARFQRAADKVRAPHEDLAATTAPAR